MHSCNYAFEFSFVKASKENFNESLPLPYVAKFTLLFELKSQIISTLNYLIDLYEHFNCFGALVVEVADTFNNSEGNVKSLGLISFTRSLIVINGQNRIALGISKSIQSDARRPTEKLGWGSVRRVGDRSNHEAIRRFSLASLKSSTNLHESKFRHDRRGVVSNAYR